MWQERHNATDRLEIEIKFPGTNTVDEQGPTPGLAGGTWLTLDTPLRPFKKLYGKFFSSKDVVNIISQLNYDYEAVPPPAITGPPRGASASWRVNGVINNNVAGSCTIQVYCADQGGVQLVGVESVLSRWHTSGCSNCQVNADTVRYIRIPGFSQEDVANGRVEFTCGMVSRSQKEGYEQPSLKLHLVGRGHKYAERS